MARNGTGTFVRLRDWSTDRDGGIKILAERMDEEDDGFATGLTESIARDGQTSCSARIPFILGVTLPAGTVTAPGWNVSGDSNTGWYAPGSDNIAAACGGVKILDVLTTGVAITGTLAVSGAFTPSANDAAALGSASVSWSDLFLASGAVVNFNNGNYTLTHSAGSLTAAGGPLTAPSFIPSSSSVPSNGVYLPASNTLGLAINSAAAAQLTATALSPAASDGNALGTSALMWSDAFLASGAVINFNNGNLTLTHSAGLLTNNAGYAGTTGAFSSTLTSTAHTVTSASATALTVGLNGATNPAFAVDASTGSQAAGFKITGAATGGTVALVATDSGSNTNVTVNAKGSGTIGIGSVSTGAVTITPALTLSGALTYGGVTLANAVTGTGNLPLSANPIFSGTLTAATIAATTINAHTLGGTISGGGNQINNIIIGTTTPLAGSFTTLAASGKASFTSTDSTAPAKGTTAQRNGSPTEGDLRYNSTLHGLEYWNATAWILLGQAPTVQKFTTGTGATYTPSTGVVRSRVRMAGGGGGAGASNTNNGTAGTDTSFGSWVAKAGAAGNSGSTGGGSAGGTGGADGTGTLIVRITGGAGGPGGTYPVSTVVPSGVGGANSFGGAAAASAAGGSVPAANTGGGGSGGVGSNLSGSGGGAGEYVEFWVNNPGAITYTVGAKGTGGAAGGNPGGDGAAGIIIIEEFYS